MSDRMEVSAQEYGLVRIFTADIPDARAATFVEDGGLAAALGVERIDHDKVQMMKMEDLAGMGLSGYLIEGQGIAEAELEGDRARLDALTGRVVVVPTSAFEGRAEMLTVTAPLRHVGTYREQWAKAAIGDVRSEAARGDMVNAAAGKPPDPGGSRTWLMLVLGALLIAVLLIGMAFSGGGG